jgi:uncharacterized protein (DUF736 family)
MAWETKDNTGSLFRNKLKQKGDNRPDLTGECMVGGKKLEFSAWSKLKKDGDKWLSVSFKEPFVKGEGKKPHPSEYADDSIDF